MMQGSLPQYFFLKAWPVFIWGPLPDSSNASGLAFILVCSVLGMLPGTENNIQHLDKSNKGLGVTSSLPNVLAICLRPSSKILRLKKQGVETGPAVQHPLGLSSANSIRSLGLCPLTVYLSAFLPSPLQETLSHHPPALLQPGFLSSVARFTLHFPPHLPPHHCCQAMFAFLSLSAFLSSAPSSQRVDVLSQSQPVR